MADGRSPIDGRYRENIDAEIDRAYEMDQKGASLRDIAADLKCAIGTAKNRLAAAKKKYDAEATRELDSERIRAATNLGRWQGWLEEAYRLQDETAVKLTTKVVGGGLIQIQDRLARLLGLDAPRRLAVHNEDKKDEPVRSMAVLQAFAEELDKHEARKAEVQANDGLGEFDS